MAKIKIENIVEELDYEFKRALESAVNETLPNTTIDRDDLFRAFKRAVGHKFNTWETVKDVHVKI